MLTDCHPDNMKEEEVKKARKGWWNGVNIIVYDPNNILDNILPETKRCRNLYLNEHVVHSDKYSFLAVESIAFFRSLFSFRFLRMAKNFYKIVAKCFGYKRHKIGTYSSMNTYSENLSKGKFNTALQ